MYAGSAWANARVHGHTSGRIRVGEPEDRMMPRLKFGLPLVAGIVATGVVVAGVAFAGTRLFGGSQESDPSQQLAAVSVPTAAPSAAATPPAASPAPPAAAAAPSASSLTQAQLDQLVSPVALYPDPLLAQVLMASTYPLEVVEAARWVAAPANAALKGDALTAALKGQNWDPSVKALVPFPALLQTLSQRLEWTKELGSAFLAQQADVMAAVQSLRHQAMAAGQLKQTPQCHCTIQSSGGIISILPATQQAICVPLYNPAVVYGRWPYPDYPPYGFPVPAGFAFDPGYGIGFYPGIDVAFFGPFWGWGSMDWGGGYISVDRGRYAAASGGRFAFSGTSWRHDPSRRSGLAAADPAASARFGAAAGRALATPGRDPAFGRASVPRTAGGFSGRAVDPGRGRFAAPIHSAARIGGGRFSGSARVASPAHFGGGARFGGHVGGGHIVAHAAAGHPAGGHPAAGGRRR
jgi:hypothetical protein